MAHIKKLVLKGFKSFARETTIEFDEHMNVIVGPNGSGKSNITDALCFVLGRLSIKSIRAAKAAHLIFSGNDQYKGSPQASVELVFDNSKKTFALNEKEISIKRIVNKNGQGSYKINNATKTRQEILELLGQVGIDPHGFNIILQGEIMHFVKMQAEERRKVIEEVAGISVYEMRKEKSIKELERTEEKTKQINAILRERTNYLRNLENEREEALRFKKLEGIVKRCKYSMLQKNIQDRDKELKQNEQKRSHITKEIEKIEQQIHLLKEKITSSNAKADSISKTIQESSGLEQDSIFADVSELKQDIAGMTARRESCYNQLSELKRRKQTLEETMHLAETEIEEMKKEKGKDLKKDLEDKKNRLEEFEDLKRKYLQTKSSVTVMDSQVENKRTFLNQMKQESNIICTHIENLEKEVSIKEEHTKHKDKIALLQNTLESFKEKKQQSIKKISEAEKHIAVSSSSIKSSKKIISDVSHVKTCPLCKTEVTPEHKNHVLSYAKSDIEKSTHIIQHHEKEMYQLKKILTQCDEEFSKVQEEIYVRERDILKIQTLSEKKNQLKRTMNRVQEAEDELKKLESKRNTSQELLTKIKVNEEQFETLRLEINELERTNERNVGVELTTKQREQDRVKVVLKQIKRDTEENEESLTEINEELEEKEVLVEEKEKQAEILKRKYQNMFEEKNALQNEARKKESLLLQEQNEKRIREQDLNALLIERAQIQAKKETVQEELQEFSQVEFLNLPIPTLKEKLHKAEAALDRIGNVNMRALEVYDEVKEEYDKIKEKIEVLDKEAEEILRIIAQIDRKKKKTFKQTLSDLNTLFSQNFSQLSSKGIATLKPQDEREIFNAGVDIHINVGKGKTFDTTSLSGGEQTLIALSLIFAIQDLKPYSFYIFDEIDAALDKRNSEKLAYLFKKHMKSGQYIIITHNDSIISEASSILYGVSMQEGVSKIVSLEV